MRLLLTNDDGVDAPGLEAMREAASEWGTTTVVAPRHEQSGVSHQVTWKSPIRVQEFGPHRFAVEGTPADCVRLGLLQFASGSQWVLSGINPGGNLGCDIYMSGTVAAAREAALLGTPAIALSKYLCHLDRPLDWNQTAHWARRVLNYVAQQALGPGEFWNVNFPDPDDPASEPGIVLCPVDPGHHAVAFETSPLGWQYCGRYRDRARRPGCDVDVCFSGGIAVSRLSVGT